MKKVRGFTLTEIVVSVGLFSFLALMVSGIFIRSVSTLQKIGFTQKIQSDGRFVMNRIVDEVKTKTIDYSYSAYLSGVPSPADILASVDQDGLKTYIRKSSSTFSQTVCPDALSTPCIEYSEDGGVTWAPLTSRDVRVQVLKFFITPLQNPFARSGGAYLANQQPQVTVVLGLQSVVQKTGVGTVIFLQDTISSRVYLR